MHNLQTRPSVMAPTMGLTRADYEMPAIITATGNMTCSHDGSTCGWLTISRSFSSSSRFRASRRAYSWANCTGSGPWCTVKTQSATRLACLSHRPLSTLHTPGAGRNQDPRSKSSAVNAIRPTKQAVASKFT